METLRICLILLLCILRYRKTDIHIVVISDLLNYVMIFIFYEFRTKFTNFKQFICRYVTKGYEQFLNLGCQSTVNFQQFESGGFMKYGTKLQNTTWVCSHPPQKKS
jgi:hypothetical protein